MIDCSDMYSAVLDMAARCEPSNKVSLLATPQTFPAHQSLLAWLADLPLSAQLRLHNRALSQPELSRSLLQGRPGLVHHIFSSLMAQDIVCPGCSTSRIWQE